MRAFLISTVIIAYVSYAKCDIFSSSAHLQSLMHLERHLVSSMSSYLSTMESSLQEIKNYLEEFSGTAGRREYQGTYANDEIIGNPLQAFQLLKRLTINWGRIQDRMKIHHWESVEELTNVYKTFMPNLEDLNGAALALVRLQDTYKLNMSDLARGSIFDYQTHVEMTARDCLYLGKHSFNNGYYGHSIEWFEEALIRAHREGNTTASVEEILPFYNMAAEIHDNLELSQKALEDPKDTKADPSDKLKIVEGDNDDYRNYQALCRGETLRSPKDEKHLKCFLTNKGHPFLVLQPVKVEIFNENPYVVMFHNLMTEYEMEIYRDLATPLLTRARVQTDSHGDEVSKVRTSQTAWFSSDNHHVIGNVNKRVEAVTGLSVNMDKSHCELVQIANYGMGGHYVPHYDYLIVDRPPEKRHLAPPKEVQAGDRTATIMFYLSNVLRGGSTVFPRLGVKVSPEKGSAVFWYNLYRNGEGIEDTVHGACPVLMGEKWVANYWIREIGQAFRRKCSLDPNE